MYNHGSRPTNVASARSQNHVDHVKHVGSMSSSDDSSQRDVRYYNCEFCGFATPNLGKLDGHMVEEHCYCRPCERNFSSRNQVDQHLKSKLHLPERHSCPSSPCTLRFISRSALLKHLEYGRGCCSSGCNRAEVDLFVEDDLINPKYIKVKHRSLQATKKSSWNVEDETYRCRRCNESFHSLRELNTHLFSSVHVWRKDLYICPGVNCNKRFGRLSALVEHTESGHCGADEDLNTKRAINKAFQKVKRGVKAL